MRTVRVLGASLAGTGAEIVTVEARFESSDGGKTDIVLTGLPDPVLRESKGRIECALDENGLGLSGGRLYLNLVPAARRKSGEILDLPLALGACAASGRFDAKLLRGALFLGELGIDGRLHAVPGGLAAAIAARAAGVKRLFAPPATAAEAACVGELEVHGPRHLAQVIAHLAGGPQLARLELPPDDASDPPARGSLDEVRGLVAAKHALAVAAAGGHGLLFVGPPGAGKSMLASRLVRLLPPPSRAERIEISRVLSASGRWPGGLARERPYRAPHHTTSYAGLVGGGAQASPGEITLAHCGVLFLDELPEFRREALEALRQPLESGSVLISRASHRVELPARFQLVAAMNPCPCGYLGHPRITCRCPPGTVQRYRRRISGPLLDRIDLIHELAPPSIEELAGEGLPGEDCGPSAAPVPPDQPAKAGRPVPPGSSELEVRGLVARARSLASERQGERKNAELSADELDRFAPIGREARSLLSKALRKRGLSARAVQSVRRVARTCADLAAERETRIEHLAQAIALRANLE